MQPVACTEGGFEVEGVATLAAPSGVTDTTAFDAMAPVVAICDVVRAHKGGDRALVSNRVPLLGHKFPHGVVPRSTFEGELVAGCAYPGEATARLVGRAYLLAACVVEKSSPKPACRRVAIAIVFALLNHKTIIDSGATKDACNAPKREYEHGLRYSAVELLWNRSTSATPAERKKCYSADFRGKFVSSSKKTLNKFKCPDKTFL